MHLTSKSRDGGAALMKDSRGLSILGSIASLIHVDSGWEAATAAALGSLADAIVVRDLTSAVSALTTLRSENLGQADVLVYEPGSTSAASIPAGLTPLTSHVRSNEISELLISLLSTTVVVESVRDAEGFGITVSYWQSEEAIRHWKQNTEHQLAREQGRTGWYAHFELRIAKESELVGMIRGITTPDDHVQPADKRLLGDVLIDAGYIRRNALQEAMTGYDPGHHKGLGHYLVDMKAITERQLASALATQMQGA